MPIFELKRDRILKEKPCTDIQSLNVVLYINIKSINIDDISAYLSWLQQLTKILSDVSPENIIMWNL